jgi:hypothetical protein
MLATRWGYGVDAGTLPSVMTPDEFRTATGGALSSSDATVEWALSAFSDALRGYCGWHVTPSLACEAELDGGRAIELPAAQVSGVSSVKVGGDEVDPSLWEWSRTGVLRFKGPCAATSAGWRGVTVDYTSGVDSPQLQALLVELVSAFLVSHPGISSQSAGGTSVSYAASTGVQAHAAELAQWRLV